MKEQPRNRRSTSSSGLDLARFRGVYARVEAEIERRYGIAVNGLDVLDPRTGDFNGERIDVDDALDPEIALFVLLHLFGHTVQWNISADDRSVGRDTSVGKTPEQLAKIRIYERDATRYAVTLLHETGVTDLDAWLSDLWLADLKYLEHYYTTGEKLDFRSLVSVPAQASASCPFPFRISSRTAGFRDGRSEAFPFSGPACARRNAGDGCGNVAVLWGDPLHWISLCAHWWVSVNVASPKRVQGQRGCKSGDNGCAAKNSCQGKGGCAVPAKSEATPAQKAA